MSISTMKFVVVNNVAPRNPAICTACSRSLEAGYLHDLSSSKHYCRMECYPRRMMVSGFAGSVVPINPFELAIAWPMLTIDVASALIKSVWGNDHV